MTAPAALRPAIRPDLAQEGVRVRLGASPDSSETMLLALAADPAITVRAAVAMNPAASPEIDAVLAADGDERVRTLLARKLAALLPAMPDRQRDLMRAHAVATLATLIDDEAVRVRAAIADVLKDMAGAPRDLILRLAHDHAVPVSDPVVRLSPVLTPDDLLSLLAAGPTPNTATAVARRPGLAAQVAETIAAGADDTAIAALLANPDTALRESTIDMLIARAAGRTAWHEPLVRRPHLSTAAARALSDIVATQLLEVLASRTDLAPELLRDLKQRVQARLTTPEVSPKHEPSMDEALGEAAALRAADRLDEPALLAAAGRGESRLCRAMLAIAADLPITVIDRAATLRSAKGMIALVWHAGFSVQASVPMQVLLARLAPSAVLRPNSHGEFPLSVDEMRWQLDFLSRMGR